jgi:hypothetical protein
VPCSLRDSPCAHAGASKLKAAAIDCNDLMMNEDGDLLADKNNFLLLKNGKRAVDKRGHFIKRAAGAGGKKQPEKPEKKTAKQMQQRIPSSSATSTKKTATRIVKTSSLRVPATRKLPAVPPPARMPSTPELLHTPVRLLPHPLFADLAAEPLQRKRRRLTVADSTPSTLPSPPQPSEVVEG